MNFEKAGGAIGFGVGAGLMTFVHIRNLAVSFKEKPTDVEKVGDEGVEKIEIFSGDGLEYLLQVGYVLTFPVGSSVLIGLLGFFIGKRIGAAIDNKLAPF